MNRPCRCVYVDYKNSAELCRRGHGYKMNEYHTGRARNNAGKISGGDD